MSCPQVRKGLGHIDPYFLKLADAMVTWTECWKMCNTPGFNSGVPQLRAP